MTFRKPKTFCRILKITNFDKKCSCMSARLNQLEIYFWLWISSSCVTEELFPLHNLCADAINFGLRGQETWWQSIFGFFPFWPGIELLTLRVGSKANFAEVLTEVVERGDSCSWLDWLKIIFGNNSQIFAE